MKKEQCSKCEARAVLHGRKIVYDGGTGAWEHIYLCETHAPAFIRDTTDRWEIKQLPVPKDE